MVTANRLWGIAFDRVLRERRTTNLPIWAVYIEHDVCRDTWEVTHVRRWRDGDGGQHGQLVPVAAKDELDAFREAHALLCKEYDQ